MIAFLAGAALTIATQAFAQQFVMFPGSSGRYLGPGELSNLSCFQLWVARNEIYDRNGYCFRTQRGRSFFNNAGCWTNNARLNGIEQANVANIIGWDKGGRFRSGEALVLVGGFAAGLKHAGRGLSVLSSGCVSVQGTDDVI